MAIDRNALIQTAYAGFGKPSRSLLQSSIPQPTPPAGSDKYTAYDPAGAKALLTQGGYAPNAVSFTLNYQPAGQANATDLATVIQTQLAAVGIKMDLNPVGSAADFSANAQAHKYQATFGRFTTLINDVAYWSRLQFTSMGNKNLGYFENAKLDSLTVQLASTIEAPARDALVTQIQAILGDDLPTVPLVEEVENWAYKTNLVGVFPNALATANFQDMSRK